MARKRVSKHGRGISRLFDKKELNLIHRDFGCMMTRKFEGCYRFIDSSLGCCNCVRLSVNLSPHPSSLIAGVCFGI